jgi:L-alanine-DL-glutamate epimerase-like enolase superfamily enzyme
VRLYASGGCRYDWRNGPEQLIEEALTYVDLGYTAMKFRIGTEWRWDAVTVDRFLGLVRELAQTVAGRLELMLDGNCRLTEDRALPIAQELDRLGFAWFEEPIPREEIAGYARLCEAVAMPITGGESYTTLEQFRPYLERRAYDIVQPDAGLCGITEAMRVAQMAHRYGVGACPHSWHNGLMAMANAHLVAALPDPHVLELCMHQGPLQWEILAQKPTIVKGWLELPDKPGLGVELREDLEQRYPYIEGHYALQVTR